MSTRADPCSLFKPTCIPADVAQPLLAVPRQLTGVVGANFLVGPFGCSHQPSSYYSHFQFSNCSRNSVFLNFPTLVRGIISTNTMESGSCHFAKVTARCCLSSSAVAECPGFNTTAASGRSCHFGCGNPTTHASFTAGCPIKQFYRSTELIHSPPDFTKSFARSIKRT